MTTDGRIPVRQVDPGALANGNYVVAVASGKATLTPVTETAPYAHHQVVAAATWTVVHNLGYKPMILLFIDSVPGEPVITDLSYPDNNTVIVEHPAAESGWAYAR